MAIEIYKAIYVSALSLGLLTLFTLLFSRRGEKRIDFAIATLVAALMASPVNAYLSALTGEPIFLALVFSQSICWLYGPLIFLILHYLRLQKIAVGVACLHFIPFIAVVSLRFSRTQLAPVEMFLFWAYFLQISAYLGYCFYHLYHKKNTFLRILKDYKQGSYYWLSFLIPILALLTVWDATVITIHSTQGMLNLNLLGLIATAIAFAVCVVAFLIVFQPKFGRDQSAHTDLNSFDRDQEISSRDEKKPALRNIELTPGMVDELKTKLEALIISHQLYLDESLSLDKLAALVGVSRNQLSELLNVHMETSFYDFLNLFRHREAMKLLGDPHKDFTITDIAYRAGFNNRNSFYRVFKQQTGQTPSEYRQSLKH